MQKWRGYWKVGFQNEGAAPTGEPLVGRDHVGALTRVSKSVTMMMMMVVVVGEEISKSEASMSPTAGRDHVGAPNSEPAPVWMGPGVKACDMEDQGEPSPNPQPEDVKGTIECRIAG